VGAGLTLGTTLLITLWPITIKPKIWEEGPTRAGTGAGNKVAMLRMTDFQRAAVTHMHQLRPQQQAWLAA